MRNIKGLIVFLSIIIVSSCKTTQNTPNADKIEPLFTVDSVAVYPDEFLYAYEKSNKNKGETEALEDYLDLYVDFKLKVQEAKAKRIDTTEAYQEELSGYLEEIKKPYLTAEKVNKALVEEAYSRLQKEINASHILIRVEKDAKAADTVKAFEKISEIKSKYEAGAPFDSLARAYSEDPSAQNNSGALGWFTAFQMVYPFESAAYQTKAGDISPIIRTQFGYHLIKVNDVRETLGRIKIAHIMKRFPPKASKQDSLNTEMTTRAIHKKLMNGENWFILATEESEDLNTKDNGGSLPWFGSGNLPPQLESAAFELQEKGDISQPVKSPFGWHILKLEDKRGVGSLESMRESLSRRVQRDQRSELKEVEVIRKLKVENNFTKRPETYSLLKSKQQLTVDDFKKKELDMVLFTIANEQYYISDFLKTYDTSQKLEEALQKFENASLIDFEEENLEVKYPEYRFLRQEYKDGLLLFEIMNQQVWSKIGKDTVGLREFYDTNKNQYKSNAKMEIARIVFSDTSAINPFKKPINGIYFPLSDQLRYDKKNRIIEKLNFSDSLENKILISLQLPKGINSEDSTLLYTDLNQTFSNMEVVKRIYSDENEIYLQLLSEADANLALYNTNIDTAFVEMVVLSDDSEWSTKDVGDYIKTVANNGMIELSIALRKDRPQQKTFDEAKPTLLEDYQKHIENEWLEKLRSQYSVTINERLLNKLTSQLEE
jgi:peptidyl-prolyl cis-trans isomerase SurA